MRRRLHLHIGHAKCASTSLQQALSKNADALRARGFLIADRDFEFPERGPQSANPVRFVADACERREEGLREVVQRFHDLGARLGDRDDQLVVSAESLSIPGAEYLATALRHAFEVHVVYYIRRQEDFLVSAWAQWGCKLGLGLVDYVERELEAPQPNYRKVLGRWQPVADRVRVRPLHGPALAGGDVVRDFFAAIGAGFEPDVPQPANQSLDVALLELFASSPFLFSSEHDVRLVDWLRANAPPRLAVEKATLGRSLRERIAQRFAEQNRALHAEHFPDVDLDAALGPKHVDDGPPRDDVADAVDRTRRALGVQLHILEDLHRRVERLERGGSSDPSTR